MEDFIGKQLGRYRITERLGMGGMANIYKAFDSQLEREVAIKFIRTKAIPAQHHARLMKRFEYEAKAQAKFDHPHIVKVFEYGFFDESPYIVMEYIPGRTLKDRITGPVSYIQAVKWILPVADALNYAHKLGIIHRDVKPSNILMKNDYAPMLTDFGIAKFLEDSSTNLTMTRMGIGTPEYMAPEQWRGKASMSSDQYALGIVLYELLTGCKPFIAETPMAIALKQLHDPIIRPSKLVSEIPESIEKIIYKVLANDPVNRYSNLGELHSALERAISEKVVEVAPPKSQPKEDFENPEKLQDGLYDHRIEAKTIRKRKPLIFGIFGVFMVLFFILGFFLDGNLFNRRLDISNNDVMLQDQVAHVSEDTSIVEPLATENVEPTIQVVALPTPTITPTPPARYLINYIDDDAIWQFDLFEESSEFIMDIIHHDVEHSFHINYLDPSSYMWDRNGNYLAYAPRFSSRFGSDTVYKGLYLYDILTTEEIIISDKISYYKLFGWSDSGDFLLFLSGMEGMPGLFLYHVESQYTTSLIYQSGLENVWNIDWDEHNNYVEFCLSDGCFIYQIIEGFTERIDKENDYLLKHQEVSEYLSYDEKNYRPGIWIDDLFVLFFWESKSDNEEGILYIVLEDSSTTNYSGPEYDGISNAFDYVRVGNHIVFESFFTGCFFLFKLDDFGSVNKYCFGGEDFSSRYVSNRIQISSDEKYLFLFTQNQITFIELDTLDASSAMLSGQFLAPQVHNVHVE